MFPYEIKPLDGDENERLTSLFRGEKSGFCQVGPDGWLLPLSYRDHAQDFYSMELREDDVFIVTFPRTGTTFNQELIWMVNNDMDFERSANVALFERFPFIELEKYIGGKFFGETVRLVLCDLVDQGLLFDSKSVGNLQQKDAFLTKYTS